MHTRGKWGSIRSIGCVVSTEPDNNKTNQIASFQPRGEGDIERADNIALTVSCVNGCKAVSEDNAKIVGENVAEAIQALRESAYYIQHLIKFLRYQRPGKEFEPNREGGEGCLDRINTLLSRIDGKE